MGAQTLYSAHMLRLVNPILRPTGFSPRSTVQLWTQIVGKVCLALAPPVNHWWGITLRVSATGLETPLLPYRGGGVQMDFDFLRHMLNIATTTGARRELALERRSVADF